MGILHSTSIKICIFEPFSPYRKVGVNKKYLLNMSCFWGTIIVYFTSFKDQFNPGKWKKSLKVKNFVVVTRKYALFLLFVTAKNWPPGAEVIFLPKKFYFEIFPKTNAVSLNYFTIKIYSWAKFKGNWFSYPKRSGPVLERLSLKFLK